MSLFEIPFVYWEWEEPPINVLYLEHFGMGEIILKPQTLPKTKFVLFFNPVSYSNFNIAPMINYWAVITTLLLIQILKSNFHHQNYKIYQFQNVKIINLIAWRYCFLAPLMFNPNGVGLLDVAGCAGEAQYPRPLK